ncbi:MAG: hypothetical protein EON93_25440, partial [Burkholderiales bacterium]
MPRLVREDAEQVLVIARVCVDGVVRKLALVVIGQRLVEPAHRIDFHPARQAGLGACDVLHQRIDEFELPQSARPFGIFLPPVRARR